MRHGRMVALLACVLACVLGSVAVAAPAYTVEMVQVVHRHGSRSASVWYNTTQICGTLFPCGYLNYEGQQMLLKFGSFLRERYTSDPSVVSTPFLTSDSYNLSVAYSRSTDLPRTLQSADAFLKGLFPNTSAFYPAIHTTANEDDFLLASENIPDLRMRYNYGTAHMRALSDPLLDAAMTFAQLQAVAAEVYSDGYCSDYTARSDCAQVLCDIGITYQSTGQLESTPLLKKYLGDVCAVLGITYYYVFGFNQSNPVHVKQGAPYYHMTTLFLSQMLSYQNVATAPTFKLYEYSAHDTTLAPLAASLGDSSLEAMLPPYGAAFLFELLSSASPSSSDSAGGKSWYVRVLRANPGATPSTNFTYALTPFDLRCMDASGTTYVAADNVCPFADFQRYIASTAPTSALGRCYIDPDLVSSLDCPTSGLGSSGSLSDDCVFYRQVCGAYACGSGYYLSALDYGCYRNWSSSKGGPLSSGSIAALSVCLFIAGVLIGALAFWVTAVCIKRHSAKQPPDTPF